MNDDTAKARLIEEGLYDEETCDAMTAAEAKKLWQLHQMCGQAFDAADEAATAFASLPLPVA